MATIDPADLAELEELRTINQEVIAKYAAAGRTIQGFDQLYLRVMLEHLLGDQLPHAQLTTERLWGEALDAIQAQAPLSRLAIAQAVPRNGKR